MEFRNNSTCYYHHLPGINVSINDDLSRTEPLRVSVNLKENRTPRSLKPADGGEDHDRKAEGVRRLLVAFLLYGLRC